MKGTEDFQHLPLESENQPPSFEVENEFKPIDVQDALHLEIRESEKAVVEEPESLEPEEDKDDGDSWWPVLGIAAAVIVVGNVLNYRFYRRRRRRNRISR